LLDPYVDAALEPARVHSVAAHLRSCAACEALHQRLRVVDGLLMTARVPGLDDDFAAHVMAEVRLLPRPQPQRKPLLPLAAFYLVTAWIVTVTALAFARPHVAIGGSLSASASSVVHAVAQGTHALWPIAPIAIPAVVSVLTVDVLLFAAVVFFYRRVRPRLTAYITAPVEAG
jgi:anti-sigma factor RsiW